MSKKGYSPDDSVMEGFSGRLKNEFVRNRNREGASIPEFAEALDGCREVLSQRKDQAALGMDKPRAVREIARRGSVASPVFGAHPPSQTCEKSDTNVSIARSSNRLWLEEPEKSRRPNGIPVGIDAIHHCVIHMNQVIQQTRGKVFRDALRKRRASARGFNILPQCNKTLELGEISGGVIYLVR